MTKLDWDRERRDRAAREHGTVRAGGSTGRAVPPSDKLVDRLVRLGYTGPRPATSALAQQLIREARQRQTDEQDAAAFEVMQDATDTGQVRTLGAVGSALERLLGQISKQPKEISIAELARLKAELRDAYKRAEDAIEMSDAKTTVKWNKELGLANRHAHLKRVVRKIALRLE